jgi:hypothetical protein
VVRKCIGQRPTYGRPNFGHGFLAAANASPFSLRGRRRASSTLPTGCRHRRAINLIPVAVGGRHVLRAAWIVMDARRHRHPIHPDGELIERCRCAGTL